MKFIPVRAQILVDQNSSNQPAHPAVHARTMGPRRRRPGHEKATAAVGAVTKRGHHHQGCFNSPQKRCGKTRLLDIIEYTCHTPLATVDATVAAIFRSLGGDHPPTLIIDEADAIFDLHDLGVRTVAIPRASKPTTARREFEHRKAFRAGNKKVAEQNEDLRKLLNAGHQRGRTALRCVGPSQKPTPFNTFAMAVLAGIGDMPDTITDRAVNISMRRRAVDERVSQFRCRRDGPARGSGQAALCVGGRAH